MQVFKRPARFLGILALVLSAALLGNAGTAAAANPLLCFSGTTDGSTYGGVCTLNAGGTSATLNTADRDPDGSYAGVYYAVSSLSGKLVGTVNDISFMYSCTTAATCVTGGSPRVSIPIDTNGNGTTEGYAFIDAANCGQAGATSGTVNLACPVFFGGTLYANWTAFATANPTYRIATDAVAFVIADQPFQGIISNVQLGQGESAGVATSKDECKKGGWASATRADGSAFKNQGDCIQYVNTGK